MTEALSLDSSRWRVTSVASVLVFFVLVLLFHETTHGMVHIWYNFETYTHGFLILPITLWLIWQKRHHLAGFTPMPAPGVLVLTAGGLVVWSLARLTGVLVVEQFAFVSVLITAMVGIVGWQVSKFLAFPLLFLLFAVPMGEDLIPPLMEFTATFTVEALRLTGIPVYRDGLWFSLPSGNWSVVEACSGVRYLIASVTLGVMYAYITYHMLWKRLLFILMSAVVPIIANGIRAYMIVMIGHLSEMEYAVGVDHLIYGWVFFGIVMFLLFWIGSFWQETQEPPRYVAPPRSHQAHKLVPRTLTVTAIVLLAAAFAVFATDRAQHLETEVVDTLEAPVQAGTWRLTSAALPWSAAHLPTAHKFEAVYSNGHVEAQVHVVLFPHQYQGYEAINSQNQLTQNLRRSINEGRGSLAVGDTDIWVNRKKAIVWVDTQEQEYLVWQWYRVAGHNVANRYIGKAWEAVSRIYPGRDDGAWIAMAVPLTRDDRTDVERQMNDFATQMVPKINNAIDRALGIGE